MATTELNLAPASAEIWLAAAICTVLVAGVLFGDRQRWLVPFLSIVSLAVAAWLTVSNAATGRVVIFNGFFVADPMGDVLKLFAYGAVAVSFLYAREYLRRRELDKSEFYVLALCALLGVMIMISANSLLTIYLGVELLSLSLYALVAFDRDSGVAAESAMKYFVLGAIASGTLLYGMSMIYGVTGSLQIDEIALGVHESGANHVGLIFGLVFLIAGVAFKFGAVPFHMWVPDVYHGAPTPIAAFIGSVPKIASFVLAIRLLVEGLGEMSDSWQQLLIVLAVLSMAIGNVVAIAQTNLKRMLAYSTISHVGFILLGIIAGTPQGYQASMYYTLAYVIMALGSFGMILLLSRKDFEADRIDDFKGLAKKSPWSAAIMLMLMMSSAGVPPFVGFWAKLQVLQAIVSEHYLWLAAAAVTFSVIGAFYYLRIVKVMYFDSPEDTIPIQASSSMRLVLSANGLAVLVLGVMPSLLLDVCIKALS
jgi:NADH-quinone oxidoreductase subunit N